MKNSFPPPGFIPDESQITGITVFKPIDPKEAHREIIEFTCIECGASRAYDMGAGNLTCTHCGHYESPTHSAQNPRVEKLEFTLENMERAAEGWGVARKELACQNCGGHTVLAPQTLTHTCPFCHSHNVIQQQAPQDVLRPRWLIPMKVTVQEGGTLLRKWAGNSWLLPKDLSEIVANADLSLMYLPYWVFDSETYAKWQAMVGYEYTSNQGKLVTRWTWESGEINTPYSDLLVSGSAHIQEDELAKIGTYQLSELVPYSPAYQAGAHAQAYEVSLDQAWTTIRQKIRTITHQKCRDQPGSEKVRNFRMVLDFKHESWAYVLLPILIGSYEYEGKPFQVLINGQTGTIAGERPINRSKIRWVALVVSMLLISAFLATWFIPQLHSLLTYVLIGIPVLSLITIVFIRRMLIQLNRHE